MSNREKIFDLLIADALTEKWDAELQTLSDSGIEPHEFSDEFEKNVRKIKNSIGRKDNIKTCARIVSKIVITAAAVLGVISGMLLTQPDVYAAVQNVIRTIFNKYDRYEFESEELTIENFDNTIRLGYVPDGYYLANGYYYYTSVLLVYKNQDGDEIMFDYGIADGTSGIYDNEHNSHSCFYLNGIEYHYYESNDIDFQSSIVWYTDGYVFSVSAQISKEEFVKIAKNLK